jgi:hypothetical protein
MRIRTIARGRSSSVGDFFGRMTTGQQGLAIGEDYRGWLRPLAKHLLCVQLLST